MPVTAFDQNQYMQKTDDGASLNFWDADFKNLHLRVPVQETVIVDARWEANLPGLAAEKLGSRYLWWAILMYNGLDDAITDVYPGRVLRIPSRTALMTYMENVRSSKSASASLLVNPGTTTL